MCGFVCLFFPWDTSKMYFHPLSLLWPFCFYPHWHVCLLFSANEPTEIRINVCGADCGRREPKKWCWHQVMVLSTAWNALSSPAWLALQLGLLSRSMLPSKFLRVTGIVSWPQRGSTVEGLPVLIFLFLNWQLGFVSSANYCYDYWLSVHWFPHLEIDNNGNPHL